MTENTPTTAEELAPAELEQVTAAGSGPVLVALGDGSVRGVRSVGATDLAAWQTNYGSGG